MKFLVDMPLSPALAAWLRGRGHDAVHALELNLGRAPDRQILECACQEHPIVVTADLDYPRLLAIQRAEEPGLILFRGGNYSEQQAKDRLEAALRSVPQEQLPHAIITIHKDRIRRRRLPLP